MFELNTDQLRNLNDIAENSNILAGDQARAILNMNGYTFFIPPVFPIPQTIEERSDKKSHSNSSKRIESIVAIPNPAKTKVKFKFSIIKNNNYEIIISNLFGDVIDVIKIENSTENSLYRTCSYLANGLYFYNLRKNDKLLLPTKKLIIIK